MNTKRIVGLMLALAVGLPLTACKDTKTLQENEQLKAHIAQLQKDSGDLGNRVDVLTKENSELKDEIELVKKQCPAKKAKKSKTHRHHHRASNSSGASQE
jgi:cell division protein FtsB